MMFFAGNISLPPTMGFLSAAIAASDIAAAIIVVTRTVDRAFISLSPRKNCRCVFVFRKLHPPTTTDLLLKMDGEIEDEESLCFICLLEFGLTMCSRP